MTNLMCFYANFMPYWNFEYTKALTLKVGGGIDPATEVTHLG